MDELKKQIQSVEWRNAGAVGVVGNFQYTPTVTSGGMSQSQSYMASSVLHN